MSFNKPTSWLQAAVVASSMLLPGACEQKPENAPQAPVKNFFLPQQCQETILPEEALAFLDEIATRIRIHCPEGFEEDGYPCGRTNSDGSTTIKYSSETGTRTTQNSISVIGGRKNDDTMRIRANLFDSCTGNMEKVRETNTPEQGTLRQESSVDLQGGWETIQNGETHLRGEISHEISLTIKPVRNGEDDDAISITKMSALGAKPTTLTKEEVINTLRQNSLRTHLTE